LVDLKLPVSGDGRRFGIAGLVRNRVRRPLGLDEDRRESRSHVPRAERRERDRARRVGSADRFIREHVAAFKSDAGEIKVGVKPVHGGL
jgi:hypothetical protein